MFLVAWKGHESDGEFAPETFYRRETIEKLSLFLSVIPSPIRSVGGQIIN